MKGDGWKHKYTHGLTAPCNSVSWLRTRSVSLVRQAVKSAKAQTHFLMITRMSRIPILVEVESLWDIWSFPYEVNMYTSKSANGVGKQPRIITWMSVYLWFGERMRRLIQSLFDAAVQSETAVKYCQCALNNFLHVLACFAVELIMHRSSRNSAQQGLSSED